MSENQGNVISAVADAGVSQLIDIADQTSKAALEAVVALEDAAVATVQGGVNVADTSFDAVAGEVETARQAWMVALRKAADAVLAPLKAIG
jgi:autotransporter adhesin